MIRFPCPHCGANLKTKEGSRGTKRRCPQCDRIVYLLEIDDEEFREENPYMQWTPCSEEATCKEHRALARLGINGTNYFHRDDPLLAGWWAARRKGLPPCRCTMTPISTEDALELELRPVFVRPAPFDPWGEDVHCGSAGAGPSGARRHEGSPLHGARG
jgi:hypothetical protein